MVIIGGKSYVIIFKCSFEDGVVLVRDGFIIKVVFGNGNVGIVMIVDSLIKNSVIVKNKVVLFISFKYCIRLVNIILIVFCCGF